MKKLLCLDCGAEFEFNTVIQDFPVGAYYHFNSAYPFHESEVVVADE